MVKHRVNVLDAMINQLSAAGIEVSDTTQLPNGDFAWASDCGGRRFELWKPAPG